MKPKRWGMLQDFVQDLRYGLRTLATTPGFTLVAVFILTLGIGANAAIFTLVNTLFFQPPPRVAEPERLVRVHRYIGERPTWWGWHGISFQGSFPERSDAPMPVGIDPPEQVPGAEAGAEC